MEFIKKNKNLLILLVLASICLFFSVGHVANIFIDIGREMYYPEAILDGKVLYKDLFCIYGPFSYLFNALIYKIFGIKLSSLYLTGSISALLILSIVYLISKKFLSEFISLSIAFSMVVTGCLATRIFNFTLPYSYAVLYGLLCFFVSVYFLIKYLEDKKEKNLIISSIFGGFAVSNKYDFILYILPLSFIILKTKNLKLILKSMLSLFVSFSIPFIILFFQGLQIKDLINALKAISEFTNTESLRVFYTTQGVYYTNKVWLDWLFKILSFLFYSVFIYFGLFLFDKKGLFKKTLGVILIAFGCLLTFTFVKQADYLFLTFLVLVLFILKFRKNNLVQNIFILSAILISLKSLWGLSHTNYGVYYLPSILISFFILISNPRLKKTFALVLIFMTLQFLTINLEWLYGIQTKIETNKGYVSTLENWGVAANKLINYIDGIKKENPEVVIFPEGLSINFLSSKKTSTEGFYNSLIPLYVEGFGEEKIVEYYKNKTPDVIVISNFPAYSYGRGAICETYAFSFCSFLYENYNLVDKFYGDEEAVFVVFEKK